MSYISAGIQDNDEILEATPTFSKSSNSMGLSRILRDISGSRKSKMAAAKPDLLIIKLVD